MLDPYHTTKKDENDENETPLSTPKVLFGLTGHTTRINAV